MMSGHELWNTSNLNKDVDIIVIADSQNMGTLILIKFADHMNH